ncbi:glutamate carboxypeptidase-like protein 2 [Podospora aff. communis PSN243]|uniref:Glutamate carboxypeptidase-like protein 2 n=1 Tax=Podospora aff. communis PSN243 TaxID=3040156 RepID=A0AAV9GPI4_9PEZI|nr:glutamate carboxypeptidase-like protein 2 [Podospora aff. communis PSN243]
MKSFVPVLSLAGLASACLRDFSAPHTHRKPLVRRAVQFPPVLTEHETLLANSFDANSIDDWAHYYGHENKLAGLGKAAAEWTRDRWAENGVDASLNEYHVYLSYPVHQSLAITHGNGTSSQVKIQEDALPEDDATPPEGNVPTFNGYSASGNVTAEYIYVGRGSGLDFERLVELGVKLEGKIALIRYGGLFRGLKVKNAQDHGMIGAVIFTDPADDGNVTVAKGVEAYPNGPARNPDAVQKGSVLFLSTYPGDPTTPGYPSHEGVPRADPGSVTPKIPSLPISYRAAQPLLQALDGHGLEASAVNRSNWKGALEAEYRTGPAPGVTLSLNNQMEEKITPVWNVIGFINGTNSDETIVIGNHRDTWMRGGTGDPNSGSAILVEFTKAIKKLRETGWKPKRNVVLGSWDAEEYGLLGSTEWVEEHVDWLKETAVAYLNIDVAVSGPRPGLGGTPELHTLATETFKKVIHPNFGAFNISLYDAWQSVFAGNARVEVLGSGSDFTAFLHSGISALDMGAGQGSSDPIWHYHSNYDTYHWMANFGDPGFHMHAAIGQYLSLLVYHLVSDTIIPFDIPVYTTELRGYLEDLDEAIAASGEEIDTAPIAKAIDVFEKAANAIDALAKTAGSSKDAGLVKLVNSKYRDFQRGFVSQGGLPNREFYKHVVTAPGLDTGYAAVTFAGVTEGVQYKNYDVAREWVGKVAGGILRAAEILAI